MSRRQSDVLDFSGVTVETLQGLVMLLCRVAVRIGARVASLAMRGPALVPRTDVDPIADSGIKFEDLGELDPTT
jgi:hypothetical protein